MSTLNSKRPVNLNLLAWIPLTAAASITHRITGVLLLAGVGVILYSADLALTSPEGFASAKALISAGGIFTFLLWATLVALVYHFYAGIKHILLDFHIADSIGAAYWMSIAVIVLTAIDAVLLGAWLW